MRVRNPRSVYVRMTGWGQLGPMACFAGHDINYIVLAAIGPPVGRWVPPLNLICDFGGGSMFLAFGIMVRLHRPSGEVSFRYCAWRSCLWQERW